MEAKYQHDLTEKLSFHNKTRNLIISDRTLTISEDKWNTVGLLIAIGDDTANLKYQIWLARRQRSW